jgi:hypothetical protein
LSKVSINDNRLILEVMRCDMIELEAHAHMPNPLTIQRDGFCHAPPSTEVKKSNSKTEAAFLSYQWTQTGPTILDVEDVGWNARSLNIPGNLLKPGLLYNFQVQVWLAGFPLLSSTASVAVRATPSPLFITIVGGDRSINALEDLYVEASVYDPDDSVDATKDQLQAYELTWSCNNIVLTNYYNSDLYPSSTGAIRRILLIRSSLLQDQMSYVFTVTVRWRWNWNISLKLSNSCDFDDVTHVVCTPFLLLFQFCDVAEVVIIHKLL